jgi:hypothetical protein
MIKIKLCVSCAVCLSVFLALNSSGFAQPAGDELLGSGSYDQFEKPQVCGSCHVDFYMQWQQAMMSQSYTHHWDEIEYFKLAVPHAEKDPVVAGVKAGCNGCHAPMAFIAGNVPPPPPDQKSRANEGVSCDVCHTITGLKGDTPHNFSFTIQPGRTKNGNREGVESPHHITKKTDFISTTEFCGNCHNEKSPYGIWVKSTQLEWKAGPYAKEGVRCHDCHMPKAESTNSKLSKTYPDVSQHLFHGAHSEAKLRGTIEVLIHPDTPEVEPGEKIILTAQVFNHKAGHKVPSGSAEERQLWLTVTAYDAQGKSYHLPVDKKGFAGEEYTISSNEPAYQDMGLMMGLTDFKGVARDALPYEGDRVFRLPYFDPQGRLTIAQWNTKTQGVDYRVGPRETKIETLTWQVPVDIPLGKVRCVAEINYRKLVKSVGEFLGVPAEEMETQLINKSETSFTIVD